MLSVSNCPGSRYPQSVDLDRYKRDYRIKSGLLVERKKTKDQLARGLIRLRGIEDELGAGIFLGDGAPKRGPIRETKVRKKSPHPLPQRGA